MKRVLVTGGAGFIGSALARRLLEEGWEVDVVDDLSTGRRAAVPDGARLVVADLADADATGPLSGRGYAAILHLAGQSSGEKSFDDPLRDLDANARSTVSLARFALAEGIPALVHASSMGVYGAATSPVSEGADLRPLSYYGASKLAAERALAVAAAEGLRTCSLRMFSVYGPGQDLAEMRQGMVSIYLAFMLRGEPVAVRGDLDRVRDFVYVDDVVDAWARALEREVEGPVNIGTGRGTRVRELIAALAEAYGLRADYPVRGLASTPGDQFGLWADRSRARDLLGWEPETTLERGLEALVAWARGR